jgi:hypothetical protein
MTVEYIQFPVPADRVADVAVFLYGGHEAMPEAKAEPKVPMSAEQRNELLTRVYVESEPKFRRLLLLLADRPRPEEPMSYKDVTKNMGWTKSRSLPGALGAYGRRANHRYGGFWPFRRPWDGGAWSHFLVMDPEVAAFLRELHAKRQLPTK